MSPQLSKQQLEHALRNLEKRVQAKKLEVDSLAKFRDYFPDLIAHASDKLGLLGDSILHNATDNYFTAKVQQALIDLEELELQLKAVKSMSSSIVVPGIRVGN